MDEELMLKQAWLKFQVDNGELISSLTDTAIEARQTECNWIMVLGGILLLFGFLSTYLKRVTNNDDWELGQILGFVGGFVGLVIPLAVISSPYTVFSLLK